MAATSKGGGEEGRLQEDSLVAALVPDPSAGPPNTAVLHGYVGTSTRANYWRLYLDAALTSYVEVSEDDVLHRRQIADDGGTFVWVPKSLELKVTRVSSTTIQAEFLSGVIAAGRMQPSGRADAAFAAQTPRAGGFQSIPVQQCQSNILRCPSDGCPSWRSGCSELDWCGPSDFRPLCNRNVFEFR